MQAMAAKSVRRQGFKQERKKSFNGFTSFVKKMIVVSTTIVEARIQSVKKKMEISRNQEMADKAAKM